MIYTIPFTDEEKTLFKLGGPICVHCRSDSSFEYIVHCRDCLRLCNKENYISKKPAACNAWYYWVKFVE